MSGGPLAGIRVLDLSRVLAGPWCTQLLADYGAEVIKIEKPGTGDDTRGWGPPFIMGRDGQPTRDSAYFAAANRGKRARVLDIANEADQRTIRDLARESDIVVENFKVDGLAKYGLDHATLRADNPRLIYCSITGFGQTGPRRAQPGYDVMIQGLSGLMSLTGAPDGEPMKFGVAIVDLMTGMYAATAILAALRARAETGEGQHIDLALFDVSLAMLANQATNYLIGGAEPGRYGNAHPNVVPYQAFETADGWMIVAVGNDEQFRRFCEAIERPDLGADSRYATNSLRIRHRAELIPALEAALRARGTAEWTALLTAAQVPCGPINTLAQVFADPQVAAREMLLRVPHGEAGEITLVANPVKFSATPVPRNLTLPE